ncbi:DUF4403 family protein [Flavobacterium sp.]|uniref:DUF4403 family protein n=1 Tax=Flavobacterium sp. TaxID=239 RepID=UPI002FDA22CC
MKRYGILLGIVLVYFFNSCSTTNKINLLKPEPDDAEPVVYENTTSFISLPVKIKLKDIENQTNKLMQGLIYTDTIAQDDNLEIKVWKQAPIQISTEKEGKTTRLKTVLPLKINAKYHYGFNKLGFSLNDSKEFNLNGVVTLISDVGLTNWQLSSQTRIKSLEWIESPTVVIAGKSVPITYLINPAIRVFKSKIEKTIDDNIKKSLNFKPQVLEALDKMATPVEMSETYSSWLRLVPIELYVTDAILTQEAITMDMGLKCNIETLIGKAPEKRFDSSKIILKPVSKMPDKINANIIAVSTYKDASELITKNFKGQEFGDGKRKVKVNQVNLWHKNGKMIIALDLMGSINGTVYLSGFPQYNEETQEIYFDKLEYVLDTKSFLLKSANWLAQGYILRKIQENCRYSLKPNLEEGKSNILNYLKNYSPMKGVYVNGVLNEFEFEKIQLTNKAILAFIKSSGKVNVTIDGLE